jgi:hypothetical protein
MALIESGFNPCAYSRMKAAGPWHSSTGLESGTASTSLGGSMNEET